MPLKLLSLVSAEALGASADPHRVLLGFTVLEAFRKSVLTKDSDENTRKTVQPEPKQSAHHLSRPQGFK